LQIVLLSINRLSGLTLEFVAPNGFLRWTDLNNMVLGLIAVLVYYLLARHISDVSSVEFGVSEWGTRGVRAGDSRQVVLQDRRFPACCSSTTRGASVPVTR
jgi:hypothetical protein